ncbi:hypothetical protein EYZ11_011073 [Aspergillus tanneri]|uniref:Major facilitator superfamily (MFS) profile domain-containing protein n=1 Tax=Aspergillus tanneri TaxID=1220188 RepID=A0A4S3J3R1_9EURO|nr:hypothetical protein EYZ11_011073 [Aspergillus tanneri]
MDSKKTIDKPFTDHDEFAGGNALALLTTPVKYDNGELRDILRSPYVFGAALLASFGGFSFGYVMSQFRSQYPETHPDNPRYGFHVGFMTAMLELGAFVGCLFLPSIADRMSRKWGLTVATVFFVVGAVIQTAALNYNSLVAGRFIGGIGVGTLAMGSPLSIPSDWAFRLPFLLQIFPALVVGCAIHFFPFSPRWLAMKGRKYDSLSALAKLRQRPSRDEQVQLEWKGILSEVRFQNEILAREYPSYESKPWITGLQQWIGLFQPKYIRRTAVALAIPFFQQFSGINAFVYYAPTFFEALGQSSDMSFILSGLVNVCQLIGGIPILILLDRIGRRKLAVLGGILVAIPHLVMAGLMGRFSEDWPSHEAAGWFCVVLIYIYILSYAISYGPLAWVLPAEVFPSSKRAKGVGAATAMIWLSNFIIGVVVPEMLLKIGWGTFLFFGIFCVGATVFSFLFVPETAQKSLEQVAELFGDNKDVEELEVQARVAREIWKDPTCTDGLEGADGGV